MVRSALEIGALGLIVQSGIFAADPDALLSRADHLAEIGNSVKARPFYAEAEQTVAGETKMSQVFASAPDIFLA
jgi:hypothetical protein